ncbi:MAG TPA: glycosyltransferase family 4 protein [Gemmatimonadales bacterium]|nr:glycosyltransferase family 4 protein [Gemmatimonadales bacterium]
MTGSDRPSLLYVVPGHDFLPSAGPTRNVVNQVRAMSRWADVTLAFRRIVQPPAPGDPTVIEIEPGSGTVGVGVDDAATRGMSHRRFARYLAALRRMLAARLPETDLVLEKDWMLTGYVAREARRAGVPAIPVKNWVAHRPKPGLLKLLQQQAAVRLEGRLLRGAPCIVAETEYLKKAMVARWQLDPERIEVIGLGVDRERFRPGDQAGARAALGIAPEVTVLLYAGVLDQTHDLKPLLLALAQAGNPALQLHVIGDGARRAEYQSEVRGGIDSVIFHGRVSHDQVPCYLAAADLCVAPYDPAAFAGGEVGYSTLKVREYLSAGRAVASVDSGSLRTLIRPGVSGFLLANTVAGWSELLRTLPSRDRLRIMGQAAAETGLESWDDVSRAFERVCARQLAALAREG